MVTREWQLSTSCYPYSNDRYLSDGRNTYFAGYDDCCPCGCRLVRADFDYDWRGEESGYVSNTCYWCARCDEEIGSDMVWQDCTTADLMQAIAEALFPTPVEPDRAPCFMSIAKAEREAGL